MSEERATKLCTTCGRFRFYHDADRYCIVCGEESLVAECVCGRRFDYALDEPVQGGLFCPRCGRNLRDRRREIGLE